jgi:hypothetical protein
MITAPVGGWWRRDPRNFEQFGRVRIHFCQAYRRGNNAVSGVGNPVSASDAANKSYVDTTTIRVRSGAEQLSVGDANGTAR